MIITIDGIKYELATAHKIAKVVGGSLDEWGHITIPAQVEYQEQSYQVVEIKKCAFTNIDNIGSATIDAKIIGKMAFAQCKTLKKVIIGNNVLEIQDGAFSDCSALTTVKMNECVSTIGKAAFLDCVSLQSIKVPNSVENIADAAFCGCNSLQNVYIGKNTKIIGARAFYNTSIKSITLPKSVEILSKEAFGECAKLKTIIIYGKLKEISEDIVFGSPKVEEIFVCDRYKMNNCKLGLDRYIGCVKLMEEQNATAENASISKLWVSHLSYEDQLERIEWKCFREEILKRDKYKCVKCGSTEKLNVHHKYYIKSLLPWEYHPSTLMTLCDDCHEKLHEEEGVIEYTHIAGSMVAQSIKFNQCPKCNGTGYLPQYSHVGEGICFACMGTGKKDNIH